MKQWMKRVRGAAGMGLLWAAGGLGVGGLIELLDNVLPGGLPMASAVDMWPQLLAIVGFLGGAIFSVVLGIAGRRRSFHELSVPRFAAWGAVAGVLLGGLTMALGAPAAFAIVIALASAAAASGSLMLARLGESRDAVGAGVGEDELGEGAPPKKLGRRG